MGASFDRQRSRGLRNRALRHIDQANRTVPNLIIQVANDGSTRAENQEKRVPHFCFCQNWVPWFMHAKRQEFFPQHLT